VKRLLALVAILAAGAIAPAAGAAINVAITSPVSGAHSLSGVVPVKVTASADSGIYGVQLYVDGKPSGSLVSTSVSTYQYELPWDTTGVAAGSHKLTANAIDWSQAGGGAQQMSDPVTVDVGPPYPTISLTTPLPWTLVHGAVPLAADVTSSGQSSVKYSVDGTAVATATANPWSATWNSASSADGTKLLTATVTDGSGQQATASANVTVDNTPPLLSVLKPQANASATGSIAVSASASDAYGMGSVQFTLDGNPVGSPLTQSDAGSPYVYSATIELTGLASGSPHQIGAVATDAAGNTKTSTPVAFTIGAPGVSVSLTAPPDYSLVHATVPVTAAVTGGTAPVTATLVVDGKATALKASAAPYTFQLDTTTLADGAHTLSVSAVDAGGKTASSPTSTHVTVDNTKPTAVVYQPAAGTRLTGSTTLQVHASDAYGIQSVQLTIDGKPVGALLTAPDAGQQYLYSTVVDAATLANGSHTVSATVTDAAGNVATAPGVTVRTGPVEYLPVLNYHEIAPKDGYSIYDQTPAEADQQLAYLKANGYQSVTLEQYRSWQAGGNIGVAKPVLITVDDGMKDEQAWDAVFKKYGFTGVMFVVTGYPDHKMPGDIKDTMGWGDIDKLAKSGRWQIAFHAGDFGHGDAYGDGATIKTSTGTLSFSAACPYFYTCLGTITTGDPKKGNSRPETFQEYQQRVTAEVEAGIAELAQKIKSASTFAWAPPFNDGGQWTNLYNDPSGQAQAWFPGYMASKFPLVFIQTDPVTYGQASGLVGSLTGLSREYRFEVHTDTTLQQFAQALVDPGFAR
jgi:hypothetical protein